MKKINVKFILMLFSILGIISCTDVFEDDISDNTIDLISPLDNASINSNFVQFQWAHLKGTNTYRIQVLDDNNFIVNDTLVSDNNYKMSIDSGNYIWRVKGENFAYSTTYSKDRRFSIINGNDLTNQEVFLLSPADNIYMQSNAINLQWKPIRAAESYTLEVEKTINGITTLEVIENNIQATTYELNKETLDSDAKYTWKVKATNETSTSKFYNRTIFVDNTPPEMAILNAPLDNASVSKSNTVTFSWNLPQDLGNIKSDITSILEIASVENFSVIVSTYEINNNSATHEFSEAGNYFWRIRLLDKAKNTGGNSAVRKLVIQ